MKYINYGPLKIHFNIYIINKIIMNSSEISLLEGGEKKKNTKNENLLLDYKKRIMNISDDVISLKFLK